MGLSEINLNEEIDYDSFDVDQIRDKEEEVTSEAKGVQEESGTNMNSNHSSKDGTITTRSGRAVKDPTWKKDFAT